VIKDPGKTYWPFVDNLSPAVALFALLAPSVGRRQIEQRSPTIGGRVINRFSPVGNVPQTPKGAADDEDI
jgi:hypothetical protein